MFWWKELLISFSLIVFIAAVEKYPQYIEGYSLDIPVDHFSYTKDDTLGFSKIIIELCPMGPPNDFFPQLCTDRDSFLRTRKQFCSDNYKHIGWTEDFMRENAIRDIYGWDFRQSSNIIFTDGTIDPWGAGGVTNATPGISDGQNRQILNFIIEGSAHHLDLRQPSSCDPENIKNVRYQIVQIIKTWLNPSLPPYQTKPLPAFAFSNVTNCEYLYNQYPWNQN